ncbi:MAG TPA: hypothetical protein VF884_05405, partial [Nitrososphaeraceae archaeon]
LYSLRRYKGTAPGLKIAEGDAGWWLRNGYSEELQILEELLGKANENNISIMCAFDISKLSENDMNFVMRNVIPYHSLVVSEEPLGVYSLCKRQFLKNMLK